MDDGFSSLYEIAMIFPMKTVKSTGKREQSYEARVCIDIMLKQGLELFT